MAELRIAYVGLGMMGSGMAANLQKHLAQSNRALLVWNRSAEKADSIVRLGASLSPSLQHVAENSDIIFTCLSVDGVVLETYDQLFRFGRPGQVFVEMSTVHPKTTQKLAEDAQSFQLLYLSCPVFGPPSYAVSGDLAILLAGPQAAKDKALPYMVPVMGKKSIDCGEVHQTASQLKLVGNFMVLSIFEMLAECLTFAEKLGLGQEKVMDFLQSYLPNTPLVLYAKRMISESFVVDPEKGEKSPFNIELASKDASHIQTLAADCGAKLPIIELVLEHLKDAETAHNNAFDVTSLITSLRAKANLPRRLKET